MKKCLILSVASVAIIAGSSCKHDAIVGRDTPTNNYATFGLSNKSNSQVLDSMGQWHNDYQDSILTKITASHIVLTDTVSIKQLISSTSKSFFLSKGIMFNEDFNRFNIGSNQLPLASRVNNFSSIALSILNDLDATIKNDDCQSSDFTGKLAVLKGRALLLTDQKEMITVGAAVSVAQHSFTYWNKNAARWLSLLRSNNFSRTNMSTATIDLGPAPTPIDSIDDANTGLACKVNLNKVGGADVGGAITGATSGSIGGPAGAFAGGLVVAGVSSSYNIINQALTCKYSWWPW
jgi:hypothetical protein